MIGQHRDINQHVLLSGETHELLSILARMQGVSQSEIVRRAIRNLANDCDILPTQQPWYAGPAATVEIGR